MPFESNTETGRFSVMRDSRRVLVKVVLFQLRGPGHPQNNTIPSFFPNSNSPMLGLSNEVSFVSKLYQKDGQNSKNNFQKTCSTKIPVHQCSAVYYPVKFQVGSFINYVQLSFWPIFLISIYISTKLLRVAEKTISTPGK